MSEIDSPLGKKSFSTVSRKTFTVTDETQDDNAPLPQSMLSPQNMPRQEVRLTPEQFNEMQARRKEMQATQKKPTSEARLRVEVLANIGRLSTEVIIDNYKFTLQSLKAGEMREIIRIVSKVEIPSDAMYEMRAQTLARSIGSVDDRPIELVIGANSLDEIVNFVNDLEEHVVNQLFVAYNDMVKIYDKKISIKNPEEAKEIAEEIKK